jgi:hypothetical protein
MVFPPSMLFQFGGLIGVVAKVIELAISNSHLFLSADDRSAQVEASVKPMEFFHAYTLFPDY